MEIESHTANSRAVRAGWRFDNSYVRLPDALYARVNPAPVREPRMAVFNHALAAGLGLDADALDSDAGAAVLAGNLLPEGAEPIAQAYAGHQFAYFTMLGDGRAILLGEQVTPQGERFDIQLKGAGQTPYSRRGDGRAALGPMLREYIISEALHALGISTTRSLAVVATGEPVFRETALPGAVLTRVAASHIRVGTFQYASACGVPEVLEALTNYTLQRHYPERADTDNPALVLLQGVAERQAALIAQWQCVGFIHGVMNTDNMALSGETIDYGPCAFMDAYHPATVFSSIDRQGRYAYGNQPPIAQWNLARLAEALLPVLDADSEKAIILAEGVVNAFPAQYEACWLAGIRAKLGLFTEEAEDSALVESLLGWMQETKADFTNTFRALSSEHLQDEAFFTDVAFADWHARWQARLSRQPQSLEEVRARMCARNPAVIPRNHRVEEALEAAAAQGDFSVMHRLLTVLAKPYDDLPPTSPYRDPMPQGVPYVTFCGT